MANLTPAERRAAVRFSKMEYDQQTRGAVNGAGNHAGMPSVSSGSGEFGGSDIVTDWGTPEGWEAFQTQTGYYPFGMQNGTMVRPANASQAPAWAQRMMGGRMPV